MKKLTIKNIVEFRGKSERSKKSFVDYLKLDKEKAQTDAGGDYWVSCLSAISSSYKSNDLELINARIEDLDDRHETTENNQTKTMYKRNIHILNNYENFDFTQWRPKENFKILKKSNEGYILTIKGLLIQVKPNHVFTFTNNGIEEVGAIWFIAKLNGFKKDELGMFAEILYRYLKVNFSENYTLSSKFCIAVDVFNNIDVSYSQLENGEVAKILDKTLDAIRALM